MKVTRPVLEGVGERIHSCAQLKMWRHSAADWVALNKGSWEERKNGVYSPGARTTENSGSCTKHLNLFLVFPQVVLRWLLFIGVPPVTGAVLVPRERTWLSSLPHTGKVGTVKQKQRQMAEFLSFALLLWWWVSECARVCACVHAHAHMCKTPERSNADETFTFLPCIEHPQSNTVSSMSTVDLSRIHSDNPEHARKPLVEHHLITEANEGRMRQLPTAIPLPWLSLVSVSCLASLLKPTHNMVGKDHHLILAKPRYNSATAYTLKKI